MPGISQPSHIASRCHSRGAGGRHYRNVSAEGRGEKRSIGVRVFACIDEEEGAHHRVGGGMAMHITAWQGDARRGKASAC
ncbi:hypothetical protein ColLi_06773 [Colletotrichum liriopes]|uniref:Uncharacterized protein n=1 Tax=Colletotrichum liriopes TaxID=708192 RepID=A0AA37LSN0_9PEZI|nr:hypothetical protein ColLi_06773 [Colletotrichum liriopes]